jgi:hypothetical protein
MLKAQATRQSTIDAGEPLPEDGGETLRIVRIPLAAEDYPDDLLGLYRRPGMELRPVQVAALCELKRAGGLVGAIGVGWGKSLIALLAAVVLGVDRGVIVCPARCVDQMRSFYALARRYFHTVPVSVLSYAQVSQKTGEKKLLDALGTGTACLVFDEAHKLKNRDAARTRRVERLVDARPDVPVVVLSGTLTTRSVHDSAHLAEWALREGSPMPRGGRDLVAWSDCLDVHAKHDQSSWFRMDKLWQWYATHKPEDEEATLRTESRALFFHPFDERRSIARRASRHRCVTAPGWVATGASALGVSLYIVARTLEIPELVQAAIDRALQRDDFGDFTGEAPDGTPLEDEMTAGTVCRYLSQGFWYEWDWEGVTPDGLPDEDWQAARKGWARAVRGELSAAAASGYDSPLLVWNATRRELYHENGWCIHCTLQGRATDKTPSCGVCDGTAAVPVRKPHRTDKYLRQACEEWEAQKHKIWPNTVTVWIDDFLLRDAVAWARKQREPVILWYTESTAIEEGLARIAPDLPIYGAGREPPSIPAPDGETYYPPHTCAMSRRSHGTGKNFQGWREHKDYPGWRLQLDLSPAANGAAWEQAMGRTHRPGQGADDVEYHVYQHTEAFGNAFRAAMEDARYIEESTGNMQKLLIADKKGL